TTSCRANHLETAHLCKFSRLFRFQQYWKIYSCTKSPNQPCWGHRSILTSLKTPSVDITISSKPQKSLISSIRDLVFMPIKRKSSLIQPQLGWLYSCIVFLKEKSSRNW